jgi:hypothetical protein
MSKLSERSTFLREDRVSLEVGHHAPGQIADPVGLEPSDHVAGSGSNWFHEYQPS